MYNCIKVLKCIFCVMPILSSAGSNISIMVQMFPNKDGSSVDGKSFSDGGIFVVFPRTISLFLLRWSFFGFISVFKPITNLFLLFSEKKMGYVSASHWFHEKRFEILFFKTMFVLLGYPPMAQFALRVGNTNAVVLLFSTKTLWREIQKQLLRRNT